MNFIHYTPDNNVIEFENVTNYSLRALMDKFEKSTGKNIVTHIRDFLFWCEEQKYFSKKNNTQ